MRIWLIIGVFSLLYTSILVAADERCIDYKFDKIRPGDTYTIKASDGKTYTDKGIHCLPVGKIDIVYNGTSTCNLSATVPYFTDIVDMTKQTRTYRIIAHTVRNNCKILTYTCSAKDSNDCNLCAGGNCRAPSTSPRSKFNTKSIPPRFSNTRKTK